MSGWAELQEGLVRDDLVLELEATSVTPARCGGYNSRPYSFGLKLYEGPRATGIKGVWRWWARAAMAGALGGVNSYRDQRLVGKLGELMGSMGASSKLRLVIRCEVERLEEDLNRVYYQVGRLRLLTLGRGRQREECLAMIKSLNLRLMRAGPKGGAWEDFLCTTLVLSLILGGVGSVTSRGLGSLRLKITNTRYGYIRDHVDRLNSCGDEGEIKDVLMGMCKQSVNLAARVLGRDGPKPMDTMPGVPSIDPRFNFFKLEVVRARRARDAHSALRILCNATTKQGWAQMVRRPVDRCKLHTWVLGFPRSVGNTGYLGCSRRASPIRLRLLRSDDALFAVVVGFLSDDIPDPGQLKWKGKGKVEEHRRELPVRRCRLYDLVEGKEYRDVTKERAFKAAFRTVVEYLRRYL